MIGPSSWRTRAVVLVLHRRPLALALETDRGLRPAGARLDRRHRPDTWVEEMAAACLDTPRSVKPSGPYTLAGYSLGGLVAFEIARPLTAAGERVDALAVGRPRPPP